MDNIREELSSIYPDITFRIVEDSEAQAVYCTVQTDRKSYLCWKGWLIENTPDFVEVVEDMSKQVEDCLSGKVESTGIYIVYGGG